MIRKTVSILLGLALMLPVGAQEVKHNFIEERVPAYDLPDPLVLNDGRKVKTRKVWEKQRRPQILDVFSSEMYGSIPGRPEGLHFETLSEETVYDGLGLRKRVRIYLDADGFHWFDVLVHVPLGSGERVPFFVGLNFKGNDATLDERAASRWPYEMILAAGFGVATAWRDSVEPDGGAFVDPGDDPSFCRDGGVRAWYNEGGDWGAISAWAWGLSRILDYLESESFADAAKVAVIGHSRLGKTALWAGANDTRFAAVISNDSGCCGAAISRRVFGENFASITVAFPHWFAAEFQNYRGRESDFPLDQNCLAALAAPRPLYIASATLDGWADPRGEWTDAASLDPVYRLYGRKGLRSSQYDASVMPEADCPIADGDVAYHIRSGKHNITAFDWEQYIGFLKRHFGAH